MSHRWAAEVTQADAACPLYFSMPSNFHSPYGLGHAFMWFNNFMAILSLHRITALSHFSVAGRAGKGHHMNASAVRDYFFGDYFTRNAPPPSATTSMRMPFTSLRFTPFDKSLGDMAEELRRNHTCNITLWSSNFQLLRGMLPSQDNYSVIDFRRAFRSQHGRESRLRQRAAMVQANSHRPLQIAVHIRRGDALETASDAISRLSPVQTYISLVRQVLEVVQCCSSGPATASVTFAAEGAQQFADGSIAIPDLNGNLTLISPYSFSGVKQLSLTSADAIESFESLCFSDIAIGSKSGFSQMAAYLCDTPVFVMMPFWHTYESIPNAVVACTTGLTRAQNLFGSKELGKLGDEMMIDQYYLDNVEFAQVLQRLVKPWCPEIRSGCVLPRRHNTTRENAPIAGKGHGAIFSRDCLSNPPEWNEVEATSSIHDETPQSSHLSLQKALPPQVSKEPTNKMAVALLFCGDANAMFSHGTWTGYADHVVRPLREDANDVHSFVCSPPMHRHSTRPSNEALSKLNLVDQHYQPSESQLARLSLCWSIAARWGVDHGIRFDWFLRARPDLTWYADMLPLSSLPRYAISLRARVLAAATFSVTSDHMSWMGCGWDTPACKNDAHRALSAGMECVNVDDQWAAVPAGLAPVYFNGSSQSSSTHASQGTADGSDRIRTVDISPASLSTCGECFSMYGEGLLSKRLGRANVTIHVAPFRIRLHNKYEKRFYAYKLPLNVTAPDEFLCDKSCDNIQKTPCRSMLWRDNPG